MCMDGRGFVGRHLKAAEHGGHEVVNRLGVEASMKKQREAQGCWCRIPCQMGVKQVLGVLGVLGDTLKQRNTEVTKS